MIRNLYMSDFIVTAFAWVSTAIMIASGYCNRHEVITAEMFTHSYSCCCKKQQERKDHMSNFLNHFS